MSSQAALQSETYLGYAAVVTTILVVAGVALLLLRLLMGRDVSHAFKSYRAWLVIVPTVAVVLFLGRSTTVIFIFALALAGFWEFARATGLIRERLMSAVVFISIGLLGAATLAAGFWKLPIGMAEVFLAFPALATAAILAVPILRNRAAGELPQIALAILGFVYIGWMFGHLALLVDSKEAYGYLCYLIVAVELNDVAAYMCGRLLGRHPLRTNISPKKTWEGSLGALAVSLVFPWLLRFSFPHFGAAELVLTGLIVGIGGQLGDLSMSVIKRDVGVKDMGTAISGHGGILDRIDSLLYVAPLFVHMVRAFHGVG